MTLVNNLRKVDIKIVLSNIVNFHKQKKMSGLLYHNVQKISACHLLYIARSILNCK